MSMATSRTYRPLSPVTQKALVTLITITLACCNSHQAPVSEQSQRLERTAPMILSSNNSGDKQLVDRFAPMVCSSCFFKYSLITNQIALGQSPSIFGISILYLKNYHYILNLRVSKKYGNLILNKFKIKNIPVEEFHSPTLEQLEEGANFINDAITKNKKIYIHCREGISRAPCFLTAYLIKYQKMNFEDAVEFIKRKRYFINLLPEQIKKINEFGNLIKNLMDLKLGMRKMKTWTIHY